MSKTWYTEGMTDRRSFLKLAGLAVLAGVAGCDALDRVTIKGKKSGGRTGKGPNAGSYKKGHPGRPIPPPEPDDGRRYVCTYLTHRRHGEIGLVFFGTGQKNIHWARYPSHRPYIKELP